MKDKKKSIIDAALLDINAIQEALMSNTKEILRSTMKEEIESVVTESLSEANDFEEEDIDDVDAVDGDVDEITADDDATEDIDNIEGDVDGINADIEDIEGDVEDIDSVGDDAIGALPMSDDVETIDMTSKSDAEVISVFKKMSGDDEIEVVNDTSVKIKDPESGNEYFVSLDGGETPMDAEIDELPMDAEIDELPMDDEINAVDGELDYEEDEDEAIYEVTIEEDIVRGPGHDVKNGSGEVKNSTAPNTGDIESQTAAKDKEITGDNLTGGFDDDGENGTGDAHATHIMGAEGITNPANIGTVDKTNKPGDEDVNGSGYNADTIMTEEELAEVSEEDEDLEEIDEHSQNSRGHKDVTQKTARPGEGKAYPASLSAADKARVNETVKKYNSLLRESKKLKVENNNFKKALSKFRDTLTETVVYNSNLTYVTKLFMENATTKVEKESIMNRFDKEVSTVTESKLLYRKIKSELGSKKPVTESIDKKITGSSNTGSGKLTESTVYADPSTSRIMDLINRVEGRK